VLLYHGWLCLISFLNFHLVLHHPSGQQCMQAVQGVCMHSPTHLLSHQPDAPASSCTLNATSVSFVTPQLCAGHIQPAVSINQQQQRPIRNSNEQRGSQP
jgi:hypothetical protein